MSKKKEKTIPNFGDIVKFRGKQYFFIGMDEDGALNMVRREDEHAFECVEFQQVWHEDWGNIETLVVSKLPQTITGDYKPWKPSPMQLKWREWDKGKKELEFMEWLKTQ